MLIVKRSIDNVEAPAASDSGAFAKNGLVFSLAGVNPAKLSPAALRKTVDPVVFISAPLNVSAVPGGPERSRDVRVTLIVAAWPAAASVVSSK